MRARQVVVWMGLSFGVVVGCRGVLGIEELGVESDAGKPSDASGDVAADSPTDAPSSSNLTRGMQRAMECKNSGKNGPMCLQCCRDTPSEMGSGGQLEMLGKMTSCICGPGADSCSTECASGICGSTPGPGGGGACGGCADGRLSSSAPECVMARTSCKQYTACAFMAGCFEGCN